MAKSKMSADGYGPYGRLVELLIEYTEKLRLLIDRPNKAGGRIGASRKEYSRFEKVLTELGEFASQRVEYGDVDDVARLEIRLRLAEFETMLQEYRQMA